MPHKTKAWKNYEEVARFLLEQFAEEFSLGFVEGKQIIPGASGTDWEIDAKGVIDSGTGFLIVECRRYPKTRLSQESVGAIAYRIRDTGADGGIIVSPLGLQDGAKKVAAAEGIQSVHLNHNSSTVEYVLEFLNRTFVGVADIVSIKDSVSVEHMRDGKVVL